MQQAVQSENIKSALTNLALFFVLLAMIAFSLTMGRYPVPLREIVRILLTTNPLHAHELITNAPWVVVEIVRLPRILVAVLCGMGLALAGTSMQGVFRNPLVGPEIAGVSAGASCGGVIAIMLSLPLLGVVGVAFAMGVAALAIAFAMARLAKQNSSLALVLSGTIVGTFFMAVVGILESIAEPSTQLPTIVFWLLGSFSGETYPKLAVVAISVTAAGTLLLLLRWRINLLSLGDDDAATLGLNVERLRWSIMALVAVIVAAQVSVSGVVGWLGLIIPHFARMLVGAEHRKLLPASAFLGGIYLLAMDDIARSVGQEELPIGLLTSVIGAPIFGYLFWKTQGKGWSRE